MSKNVMLEDYELVMTKYLDSIFTGATLVENNNPVFVLEYEGDKCTIEFDPEWSEYVYTVNGIGPFSHSSYEYIGSDCRGVLAIEQTAKLNRFQDYLRDNGWRVETNSYEFFIFKESDAGEGYTMAIANGKVSEAIDEIGYKVESFDVDELVEWWRNGNPDINLQDAIKNANSIQDMLNKLNIIVNKFEVYDMYKNEKNLAEKLVDFYKDWDPYDFMDSLDTGATEEDAIDKLVGELGDSQAVAGLLDTLNEIKENGEPDRDQLKVINELIASVSKLNDNFVDGHIKEFVYQNPNDITDREKFVLGALDVDGIAYYLSDCDGFVRASDMHYDDVDGFGNVVVTEFSLNGLYFEFDIEGKLNREVASVLLNPKTNVYTDEMKSFIEEHCVFDKSLEVKGEFLENFFRDQHIDILVNIENGHLVAKDDEGNKWNDGAIYDFALNECLTFYSDGVLTEGYGAAEMYVAGLVADAKDFGVEPDLTALENPSNSINRSSLEETLNNAKSRSEESVKSSDTIDKDKNDSEIPF